MFALYHSSGFYQAPVTKGLVGGLVLASVALNVPFQSYQSIFNFSYDQLSNHTDLLKFVASRLVFLDPKDLLCACILLYHFRIFERRYGSRKFASRILVSFFLSLLLELGAIYSLYYAGMSIDPLPTGPFGPVFSFFVPYFDDIPRVAHSHIIGVPITGKSLNYIIGLQMASSSPESLLLAVSGIIVGFLVKENIFWINHWLSVPKFIGNIFQYTLGRLIETPAPSEPFTPMGATLEIQRAEQIEHLEQQMAWAQLQQQNRNMGFNFFPLRNNGGQQPAAVANGNVTPPSEEQIRQLIDMGFNRDSVLQALQATNNNITMATNILLHES